METQTLEIPDEVDAEGRVDAGPRANDVKLLTGGVELFAAVIREVERAKRSVWLETYIFHLDNTGDAVARALGEAAKRGVDVRVVVDGFGSYASITDLEKALCGHGIHFRVYRPERKYHLEHARLRRLHRKLILIDEEVGYVGGINVLDDLVDPNHGALDDPRFDFAVEVRGPIVKPIFVTMSSLWMRLSKEPGNTKQKKRLHEYMEIRRHSRASGSVRATLLLRDNFFHRRRIERSYLAAIAYAKKDVTICNAYFFPGAKLRAALAGAARRGVVVRLLLQGRAEYPIQHYGTRALFNDLLAAGIKIFEYQRGFLHAKVAVVDNDWATVGSSNLDPFSLLLAREANISIRDEAFCLELREKLDRAIANDAKEVFLADRIRRPWILKIYNFVSYGLLRLGVLLAAKGVEY
jgi:cardiolipin synthase A/B